MLVIRYVFRSIELPTVQARPIACRERYSGLLRSRYVRKLDQGVSGRLTSTVKKSQAAMAAQCERRNVFQESRLERFDRHEPGRSRSVDSIEVDAGTIEIHVGNIEKKDMLTELSEAIEAVRAAAAALASLASEVGRVLGNSDELEDGRRQRGQGTACLAELQP
jgi:hypothetical protein